MEFKIGQKVAWESSAGGGTTQKNGEVVGIVPAGTPPPIYDLAEKSGALPQYGGGGLRKEISYVVLVQRNSKEGRKLTPYIYWPRASALKQA